MSLAPGRALVWVEARALVWALGRARKSVAGRARTAPSGPESEWPELESVRPESESAVRALPVLPRPAPGPLRR